MSYDPKQGYVVTAPMHAGISVDNDGNPTEIVTAGGKSAALSAARITSDPTTGAPTIVTRTAAGVEVQSPVSGGGTAVSGADVRDDTPPESPGVFPALTEYRISDAAAGVDAGTKVVWIPTGHATLPASKGWRFAFYPSATVV